MSSAGASKARILIVDDDPIVAESLAEFLSRDGYHAATSLNAPEALERLRRAAGMAEPAWDVVLTDVSMPAMNGLELLREIQRHHFGTAVIMLTGYGTVEHAVESLRHGA
ncbi:MAG: response regulator, partial [Planctomycetota bacterium]|nr:response regulator [Planctomycetota bacterium]